MPYYYYAPDDNAGIWLDWCGNNTTSTSNEIWITWNTTFTSMSTASTGSTSHYALSEEDAARVRARERQILEQQQQRAAASARALETLEMFLSEEQLESYRDPHRQYFDLRSSKGNQYRVHRSGQQGNVQRRGTHGPEARYCCHPLGGLPDPDAHLAQMLALVTDEDAFLAVANRMRLNRVSGYTS